MLKQKKNKQKINKEFYEIAAEASDDVAGSSKVENIKLAVLTANDIKVNGKEEFPQQKPKVISNLSIDNNNEENLSISDDNNNSKNVLNETFSVMNSKLKKKVSIAIPQRVTPDGTKIFYICDLPIKIQKGVNFIFFLNMLLI